MTTPPATTPVTESGSLTCSHTGIRALSGVGSANRLTVAQKAVLAVDADGSGAYAGCIFTDAGNSPRPCDTTKLTSAGASKLTVRGKPVLLSSDTLLSLSTGPPPPAPPLPPTPPSAVTVKAGQAKLTAR